MKRYKITAEFRKIIKNSGFSLRKMAKKCKFDVKNIAYTNLSVNETHLNKLCKVLNINKITLKLKEIKLDYAKNFGKYYHTPYIKFKGICPEFAEFCGIMLGDGNIYASRTSVIIDSRDLKLKYHIKNLFQFLFCANLRENKDKNKNAVKLYFYSKELIKILEKHGLKKGDKIKNNVDIPVWIKGNKRYITFCLRGLILTDGCVYYSKRDKQIYIKFTNHCQQLLNDFKQISKNIGFDFVKANRYNAALYKKEQVARFINTTKLSDLKHGAMV